jgi:hypothetical protein
MPKASRSASLPAQGFFDPYKGLSLYKDPNHTITFPWAEKPTSNCSLPLSKNIYQKSEWSLSLKFTTILSLGPHHQLQVLK